MENNKTKIQKIIIVVALLVSLCVLVSSFTFVSSSWQSLRAVGLRDTSNQNTFYWNKLDGESALEIAMGWDSGQTNLYYYDFWKNVQSANNAVFYTSILGFVGIAIACIAGNFSRRKYYISNLVCGLIYPVVTVVAGIVSFIKLGIVSGNFAKSVDDFELDYQNRIATQQKYDLSTDGITKITGNHVTLYYIIIVIALISAALFATMTIKKFISSRKQLKAQNNEIESETFEEE